MTTMDKRMYMIRSKREKLFWNPIDARWSWKPQLTKLLLEEANEIRESWPLSIQEVTEIAECRDVRPLLEKPVE